MTRENDRFLAGNFGINPGKFLFASLLFLLLSNPVLADDNDKEKTSTNTDPETVPSDFNLSTNTDAIDADEIDKIQASNTPAIVDEIPGVYLQKPFNGTGSPVIRGVGGLRIPVLIDEVRYSNGVFTNSPNHYLAAISPNSLQSVTVTKGVSPLGFAYGSMGGIVVLKTDQLSTGNTFAGKSKYMYASGDHTSLLSADGGVSSKLYNFSTGADITSFGDVRTGGGYKEPYSSYEQANWRARLVLMPEDSPLTVTGAYLGHYANNAVRTDQLGLGKIDSYDNSDNFIYLGLDWKPVSVLKKFNIRASYHQMSQAQTGYVCPITGGHYNINYPSCSSPASLVNGYIYNDVVDTFGIMSGSQLNFADDRFIISGKIEYYFDNVISSASALSTKDGRMAMVEQPRGLFSSGSYFSNFSSYLHGNLIPLKTKGGDLNIGVGVRVSNSAAYAPTVPEKNEDIHYSDTNLSTMASVGWLYKDIVNIYGNFGASPRTPNLEETTALGYVGSQYHIPNQDLKQEIAYNYELGTKLNISPVILTLSWFHNTINDYIDERPASWGGRYYTDESVPIVQRVNADKAVFKGFETEVELHAFDFTVKGDINITKGEVYDKHKDDYFGQLTNYVDNFPARRVPSLFGSGSIRYDNRPFGFYTEFSVNWADSQNRLHPMDLLDLSMCETKTHSGEINPSCSTIKGWYTLNLIGGYQINSIASLQLSALNLTDNRYKTLGSGIMEPGFNAKASLTVKF
ncbi:MAG: TonB-dependent receptor [Deltaproteobacteria bacterium]|nr:TonB-dependent receptor [Deltaproteobacteria bacterium]